MSAAGPAPLEQMRRLVDDLDGQHRREALAFAEGYRAGHHSGWQIGYAHACQEMADEWHRVYLLVQEHARRRTAAELLRIREAAA